MDFGPAISNDFERVMNIVVTSYTLFLSAFGTIGNVFTFLVCIRSRLRKTPTFVFIAIGCLSDILPLLTLNLANGILGLTGYDLYIVNNSLEACNWMYYLSYTCYQTSAFILVANSFDRLMSVRVVLWRKVYFNSKKAAMVCIGIALFFFIIHIHYLAGNKFIEFYGNGTIYPLCGFTSLQPLFYEENTYLGSFVPFGLLLVLNFLLIVSLIQRTRTVKSSSSKSKQRSLNISVMGSTFTFILLTSPAAIILSYFLLNILLMPSGVIVLSFINSLFYTPIAFNLITQLVFNREFLKEVKIIFSIESVNDSKTTTTKVTNYN